MSCCPPDSAPYLAADHEDEGSVRSIDGISFYQVGTGKTGLLILPDVWGWNGGRTRAIADDFAKKGLSVWVPKLLTPLEGGTDGDALPPTFEISKRGAEAMTLFKGDWHPDKVAPQALKVVEAMKSAGVKKIGTLGFCYGCWVGMYIAKELPLAGCASCHPSAHLEGAVGGDAVKLAAESKCPWAFFPAGSATDGGDPDIYDAEGAVYKALDEKFPSKNVTKRFEKMAHGFVSRGAFDALGDNQAGKGDEVKVAVQECLTDICEFFVKRGLLSRAKAGLPPLPMKLKKPKFGKVAKIISPEARGLNLMLKAVKCEEKEDESGRKQWLAVLGDETGVVTFSLRSAEHAELCKAGSSVRVQNARVLMMKGFVYVIIDKWAVLKAADEPLEFEPKEDKDMSATEYELAA